MQFAMDSIVSSALTEILTQGPNGISINDLWPALDAPITSSHLRLCNAVKRVVWTGLLSTPGLEFSSQNTSFTTKDSRIQSFEDSEKLGLKIVAAEHLRDCFLGIYDCKPSAIGRTVLERLAIVKTDGITQSQLSEELGIEKNKFFYVLKNLEIHGLIARQPITVRTKGSVPRGKEGPENSTIVRTNLLHLSRYAKHLGPQQKFEITQVNTEGSLGNDGGGTLTSDVSVNDFLPAMKFVCDKLEKAKNQVLVVSDIEKALSKTQGNISWRSIQGKLEDGGVVEVFPRNVGKKVANCVRLLKKFDPKDVQLKSTGLASGKSNTDQPLRGGKQNQLLELPIDNQIYDLIDAQGTKGLSIIDICKHLGISCKENHRRFQKMLLRYGMDVQAETHNKSMQYKVWTAGNTTGCQEKVDQSTQLVEISTSKEDLKSKHLGCFVTAERAQRERRILERLEEEKFVLFGELRKWLKSLEKEKTTEMDKRTVTRILSKLEADGLCKCVHVSIPLVTDCIRNRPRMVVLHSSLSSLPNLPPELLSKIQERVRSFEKNARVQGIASLMVKQVSVLDDVERARIGDDPDSQAVVAEAMRVNGFIPAKMVRAKLLHNFLWGYVRSSRSWATTLTFTLDAAVKAMPLELFLQVVGSTRKFKNLVEISKHGMCLVDLSSQEYMSLMDMYSKGRLSAIVNILCGLKLLRLISDIIAEDGDKTSDANSTYAMELQAYIEEPLSGVSLSLGISSSNHSPRRRDFVLSTKKDVDLYWKTLEYCYSTTDPKSAEHAFPGSSVKEVFMHRSWTSVRVMTADQRAELLKRIEKDDPKKKISFLECVEISRILNLTLEQVLRFLNDKRRRCVNALNPSENLESTRSASQKRKRSSEATISKRAKHDEQGLDTSDLEDIDDDREEGYEFISRFARSRLKPSREPRFMWSEASDKELVIQYVRNRAALGARFHGTVWGSLPHLPASSDACKRRMHLLNQNPNIHSAVMRLCKVLGERYAQHLSKTQWKEISSHDISKQLDEELLETAGLNKKQQWDNFEDQNVKSALDEVMRQRQMAKLAGRAQKECRGNILVDGSHESQGQPGLIPSTTTDKDTQNHERRPQQRSYYRHIPGKLLKFLNENISVKRQVCDSVAVANAVELLKLVFLSTSSSPEVSNMLAETLRRYSEHDLFAAFNYLREKKFLVGGNESKSFTLSLKFLHRASSSPFPTNTGKRAAKFANWLRERGQDLIEDEILLNDDLQCGDIAHLLALVSSGELSISLSLPDKGIGEVEENRDVKRKAVDEICNTDNVKRLKSLSKDGYLSRREKGFPGLKVFVSRKMISKVDVLDLIPSQVTSLDLEQSCKPSYTEIFTSVAPLKISTDGSQWETMSCYGNQLLSTFTDNIPMTSVNPELFKITHSAICKTGDQGINMDQISEVLQGKADIRFIVDMLLEFGVVVKVNAYDDVRIVDASFCSKYFLSTIEGQRQGLSLAACEKLSRKNDPNCLSPPSAHQRASETSANFCVQEVSLNPPEDGCHRSNKVQTCNDDVRDEELTKMNDTSSECVREAVTSQCTPCVDSNSYRPILPWINGDGTTNPIVYKGLVRRVLGIVMQNPAILEDNIVHLMDVLNPQSCRKLLELMILEKHLTVRKMHQVVSTAPPSILTSFCSSSFNKSTSVCRQHFFANPTSTMLL